MKNPVIYIGESGNYGRVGHRSTHRQYLPDKTEPRAGERDQRIARNAISTHQKIITCPQYPLTLFFTAGDLRGLHGFPGLVADAR
jgi:hypothetical protein